MILSSARFGQPAASSRMREDRLSSEGLVYLPTGSMHLCYIDVGPRVVPWEHPKYILFGYPKPYTLNPETLSPKP